MKTKSKALAIASPKLPATQPPPHKADIICALVERARIKNQEENAALEKRQEEATKAANDAIIKEMKDHPDNFEVSVKARYCSPEVRYEMKVIPPHIEKLRAAIGKIPSTTYFDAANVKREITAKMNGNIIGDRVAALLANPEAVKKLDETLESIGI